MNLAYFRKSSFSFAETISNLRKESTDRGMQILGETDLGNSKKVMHVCSTDWLKDVVANEPTLVGLIPCSIVVIDDKGEINIGVGSPAVLGSVSHKPNIIKVAAEADKKLKEIIHAAAGVGELKPTKIRLYSTTTCPYCQMEKNWLESNKVDHEVVYVDRDQKEAENMVRKTGQMGVPVTEVQYTEGEPEYIVGFDKARLASILNVK